MPWTVYKGYIVSGDTMADLESKIRKIDHGDTDGFSKDKNYAKYLKIQKICRSK
jgi:hypothetical protein